LLALLTAGSICGERKGCRNPSNVFPEVEMGKGTEHCNPYNFSLFIYVHRKPKEMKRQGTAVEEKTEQQTGPAIQPGCVIITIVSKEST